jgi:hypothetical protein
MKIVRRGSDIYTNNEVGLNETLRTVPVLNHYVHVSWYMFRAARLHTSLSVQIRAQAEYISRLTCSRCTGRSEALRHNISCLVRDFAV